VANEAFLAGQRRLGVVVIGRNEGDRLKTCLQSVSGRASHVLYVDSGSTDGSVPTARTMVTRVVELDPSRPFTAARARNEGFRELRKLAPSLEYVQFVDGDCELIEGWLEESVRFLAAHRDVAAVCGRLRERHPERSIYNLLCDIEWESVSGPVKSCGGISLIRIDAFHAVRGYRSDLIAGEEPELCVRLRAAGWRIWRLDQDMALHDAAMTRFSQWWTRTVRTGHAYAEGVYLHGTAPERHCIRQSKSAWCWGLVLPLSVAVLATRLGPSVVVLLAAYPLQVARLALGGRRRWRHNWARAAFLVLGKFPEMLGQLKFVLNRHLGRRGNLIEYK
jgi:GT2 family glycosyltransferase